MPERQGFGFIQTYSGSLYTNVQTTNVTSSVGVSDNNNHTFQTVCTITGNSTSSLIVQSSLDGINWRTDFTQNAMITTSSMFFLTGRRNCFRALQSKTGTVSNVTASLHILSGP